MKFNEQWLREWVNPDVSTADLAHQLTMAGLEVDAVEPVAPFFEGVVVAEVMTVAPHPNADRLRVCRVNAGQGEVLEIVCGAPDVSAGMRVPLARVGAVLPGGIKIKKSKLRGVTSEGVLCSARELGLADSADTLMPLDSDAEPGRDLRDYLRLNDVSIELGLTPNRGDCLSIAGVAREVGALNRMAVQAPAMAAVTPTIDDRFPVRVDHGEACPRYLGRVVRGVDASAETPLWMRERLRRAGLRPISPVVDVTNYVMLELGQPMHAFDLARLSGGIVVRLARGGEALTLLDGQTVTLDERTLVIADEEKALALAGVMGGLDSAVSSETRDLFLECAFFSPQHLAGCARRYGLHTDSSHRFERGVDPGLPRRAMERATALLRGIVGGEPGPVTGVDHSGHLPVRSEIVLRAQRLSAVLGAEFSPGEVTEILQRLGLDVVTGDGEWCVTPPSYRFDLAIEADLIEEVARIHGYTELPTRRPAVRLSIPAQSETRVSPDELREVLVARGYSEVVTYSFVDAALQSMLMPGEPALALANPLSSELAEMRTSLWPGLIQVLRHNLHRQQSRVRVFEMGACFRQRAGRLSEPQVLAGLVVGRVEPEQWGLPGREVDFFDAKGDVEDVLSRGGMGEDYVFEAADHPALHPGQSARIRTLSGEVVGLVGRLHPDWVKRLDLTHPPLLFELDMGLASRSRLPVFRELSRFPSIRRDLALIVGEEVAAAEVLRCVRESAGPLLQDLQLFDVYRGKGIESGKKSLALGLTLQDSSRTLIDEDVDKLTRQIVATLHDRFGAILRE
ncbi:MAG TPA: phenylalanine--tRNA ligase subunit beta [Gammaproteobacteria bacterium]|nr:phenylalanine--tRNA ligase subunit beta [Gammaproteobacteria bacterium]